VYSQEPLNLTQVYQPLKLYNTFTYLNYPSKKDLTSSYNLADNNNSHPGLIQGIYGSFGFPFAPLKGNISTISLNNGATSAVSYFEKWAVGGGISEKLPVGNKGKFKVVINFNYSVFLNSGTDSLGVNSIKPKIEIFQTSLGGEYAITKLDRIEPFIGADITASIFGGSLQIDNSVLGTSVTADYNSVSRFGVDFGAGVDYKINKDFGFVLGGKYNISNIIGKSTDLTGAHELNDAGYSVNGINIKSKTISYINLYLGFSIYIGTSIQSRPW